MIEAVQKYFIRTYVVLLVFALVSPPFGAFAATTTWDFNTPGDYTVSDTSKINLNGDVAMLTVTGISHVGRAFDNAVTTLNGPFGIDVVGDYAYIASQDEDGLEIIDISDPTTPGHVGSIVDTVTTELDGARRLKVVGDYAYVTAIIDDGLEIIDISDPANPTHVGALADDGTTALDGALGIDVVGDYAYVASVTDKGLEIIDISDPANPTHVGSIIDDGTTLLDGATDVRVVGDYAYVVSLTDNGFEVIDVSTPSSPTSVGRIADNGTTELEGGYALDVVGDYAYVAALYDDGLEIINISNPTNPTHVGAITDDGTTELDGAAGVEVIGDYAYVAGGADDGVEILDISDPTNPTHVAAITDDATTALDDIRGISVLGNYVYAVAYTDDGIEVLSIDRPGDAPYVTPDSGQAYTTTVDTFTEVLGGNSATETANHPATATGTVSFAAGQVNQGADFEGNDDYIRITDNDNLSFTDGGNDTPFSISFWLRFDSFNIGSGSWLISKRGQTTTDREFGVFYNNSGNLGIQLLSPTNSPDNRINIGYSGGLALSTWYHVAITYDGSETKEGLNLYLNGTSVGTQGETGTYTGMTNTVSDLVLGTGGWSTAQFELDGRMDEVYIWRNRELSLSDVTDIYTDQLAGNDILSDYTAGLVAGYKFEDTFNDTTPTPTYQVSPDNGVTWYYYTGSTWTATTKTDGTETNSASIINTNVATLDTDGGTFTWRAYLDGDGSQQVELDEVSITYSTAPTNNAPTDIQIDGLNTDNQDENVAINTSIGTLTTTDVDGGDTHSYSIACTTPGQDDAHFNISGDQLRNSTVFDYENPVDANSDNSYEVCIRTTDSGAGNLTYDETLVINVNDLNSAPTNIDIDGADTDSVNENTAVNTSISTITSTDDGEDNSETYTYSLSCTTPGVDDSHFNISGTSLRNTTVFDYENPDDANTDNVYSICLRVTETNGGLTYDQNFMIIVTDVNLAPTDIQIDGANTTSVNENVSAGTTVGTLSGTDDGENVALSFSLVAGAGDTDNTAFTIIGTNLIINGSPDFETQSSYSVRVQGSDGALSTTEVFTITVNDLDEVPPTITLTGTTPVNVNQNDTYTDAGATCIDDIDPTCTVTTVNPVDTATPGTYTVTYDAQDAAGNNATQVTRTVTVTAVQASRSGFRAYSPAQVALLFAKARGETIITQEEPTHPCTINYTRLITRGSRGNDVRQVQSCMNTLGYTSGPEDGIYGPLTYAGVTAYQRAKNLRYIDGVVGPETSAALNRL